MPKMTDQERSASDCLELDFDGEYGRNYQTTIRNAVPGYDAMIELAAAALQQAVPQAMAVLVVGPGPGEELVPLLTALPLARFTLVEPSNQMSDACARQIAAVGASSRCELLTKCLEPGLGSAEGNFDAVVCQNVLHLFPPKRQLELLEQLCSYVAGGGALLLSSYSEPSNETHLAALFAIACTRLLQRGLTEVMVEQLMSSRNKVVFSVNQLQLEEGLAAAGMQPPLLLQQSLCSRLWLSRRIT